MNPSPAPSQAVSAIMAAVEKAEGPMAPKKRLIVEAAILCFSDTGFAGCSTRMIANRAGVAEATIFRHFATKKDLLLRITEPVIEQTLAPAIISEADEIIKRTDGNLREFLRAILLSRLAFADRYGPFVRIMLQELLINPELRATVVKHSSDTFGAVIQKYFAEFQAKGQITDISPERVLRIILSLLAGYYINRNLINPGEWDDEAEIAAMLDVVLHGVTPA